MPNSRGLLRLLLSELEDVSIAQETLLEDEVGVFRSKRFECGKYSLWDKEGEVHVKEQEESTIMKSGLEVEF